MIHGLFNRCAGDVRFRLRQALHAREVWDRFGYILIDCPPRLTTACVNALAASDCVLIPVLPDDTSTERVPMLLEWLQRFREYGVCSELNKVGILLNRYRDTKPQQEAWERVKGRCRGIWKGQLRFLSSSIKDDPSQITTSAQGHWPAVLRDVQTFSALRDQFAALADEMDHELQR